MSREKVVYKFTLCPRCAEHPDATPCDSCVSNEKNMVNLFNAYELEYSHVKKRDRRFMRLIDVVCKLSEMLDNDRSLK